MLSIGYWYDRLWRGWRKIEDHARTVLDSPEKFRLSREMLDRAMKLDHPHEFKMWKMGILNFNEDLRASVIIRTAQMGFIRVRDTTGFLSWQFAGDPIDSLAILRRYMKRKEIGDIAQVTFTDFGLGVGVTDLAMMFKREPPGDAIQKLIETWVSRYEKIETKKK